MDGGAWWAAVHVVAKSRTRLSDFTFTFNFHALELQAPRGPAALGGPLAELGSWCVQLPCPFPGQGQVRAGREPGRV